MASTTSTELKNQVKARWPIIAIKTHSPKEVIAEIEGIASKLQSYMFRWSASEGLRCVNGKLKPKEWHKHGIPPGPDENGNPRTQVAPAYYLQPMIPLRTVLGFQHADDPNAGALIVAENLTWYFQNQEVRQLVFDVASMVSTNKKTLIIVGAGIEIPSELEKQILLLDWPLPDADELRQIVNDHIESVNYQQVFSNQVELEEPEIGSLVSAIKGMTAMEAVNSLNEAMVKLQRLDASPEMLRALNAHKKQVIGKHAMLEYFEPSQDMNQIGGLDLLKKYLQEIVATHSAGAAEFGVRPPLGILLVGPPGTGKTLSSRVAANEFQWPLIRLDLSAVFGGLVGQSEANMRAALSTIRAIAPVVIQIDEIEKAMSSRGGDMDGGTSSRVLGIFLTWLQDQMDDPTAPPMFIIATANRAMQLDSALMRRFEDTFFIDLPSGIEREQILAIHLRLAGRDPDALGLDLADLSDLADDYSGAELKKAVDASLRKAYLARLQGRAEDVTQEMIAEALQEIVPVSRSMAAEVEGIRRWSQQVRPASSGPRRQPRQDDFDEPETDRQPRRTAVPDM